MSELVTIARPYAKAVFDFAVDNNNITHWKNILEFTSEIVSNKKVARLISNSLIHKDISDIFIVICGKILDQNAQNLIKLMAENGRLKLLPFVLEEFIRLYNDYQSIAEIELISAIQLSDHQIKKIIFAMEKKLSCKVKLNYKINKSIIGGLIIRTNEQVINESIRNRFDRLADFIRF